MPLKSMEIPGMPGGMMGMINLGEILEKALDKKRKKEAFSKGFIQFFN